MVTNDSEVIQGDVYDLCVPGTVMTSPLVVDKPGIAPGAFHGAFWIAPRGVIEPVGLLDERFEGAFFEDDDYSSDCAGKASRRGRSIPSLSPAAGSA